MPAIIGSSPGGWGEGERRDVRAPRRRFIPRRLGRGPPARDADPPGPVHPQAAGERLFTAGALAVSYGSSPGGWGEARHGTERARRHRFIPRRLGRGTCTECAAQGPAVHPQAAGERRTVDALHVARDGSSPGGWGEGHSDPRRRVADRFIPRRLGRGAASGPESPTVPVHPQAAGERTVGTVTGAPAAGSSPGGWGEACGRRRRRGRGRFIPRRLGRGPTRRRPARRSAVHPQAAGERPPTWTHSWGSSGSSPGGWGEEAGRGDGLVGHRFIPRRLGRGSSVLTSGTRPAGSSPGGWGEDRSASRSSPSPRFIPRRLGRGSSCSASARATPVHPQAAGERGLDVVDRFVAFGSSPGGWGEAAERSAEVAGLRFIPRRLGRGEELLQMHGQDAVHPQAAGERI